MALNADSDIGIGFSDRLLVGVSIVGFTALVYVLHSLLSGLRTSRPDEEDDGFTDEERLIRCTNIDTLNRTQRRARAKAIMKEKRRLLHPSEIIADDNIEHENADPVADDASPPPRLPPPSRKERQQQAKVTEKELRRLFQEEREQQQRLVQMEAQRQKKERLIAATQRLLDEELQKASEEAQREELERDLWYNFIPTLSSNEAPSTPVTKTVSEFVQECQNNRVVNIPTIASQYNVASSVIVDRIQQLISDGRIAGFFQNMNQQFIHVSDEELHSIASTTRHQNGFVSIQQFATICQQVIEK